MKKISHSGNASCKLITEKVSRINFIYKISPKINFFSFSQLSEMTVELAEEHSQSNLTSERLEAEQSERLRLEKELNEHEVKYRNLQEASEKLEMELICAKSDLNG